MEVTASCTKDLKRIQELEADPTLMEGEEELAVLKRKFVLVVSADYQMAKLVPYWGLSP